MMELKMEKLVTKLITKEIIARLIDNCLCSGSINEEDYDGFGKNVIKELEKNSIKFRKQIKKAENEYVYPDGEHLNINDFLILEHIDNIEEEL